MSATFLLSYIALWLLTLTMAATTYVLIREMKRRGPFGQSQPPDDGVDLVGTTFPHVALEDAVASRCALPLVAQEHIVILAEPGCPSCKMALRAVLDLVSEGSGRVRYVFAYRGHPDEVVAHLGNIPGSVMVLFDDGSLGRALKASASPFAVAVDRDGRIARAGVVYSRQRLFWVTQSLQANSKSPFTKREGSVHDHAQSTTL